MDKKALLKWYIDAGVDEASGDDPSNYFASSSPSPLEGEGGVGGDSHSVEKIVAPNSGNFTPLPNPPPQRGRELGYSAASEVAKTSRLLANDCKTLAELEAAIRAFDGCSLKKTAGKTVFADGNPNAKILLIGEAPGVQEDIQGIPFCGPAGQLLDKMLAAIDLNRGSVFISNTVYWRPPGNRQPNPEETAICLPFVEKLVGLVSPTLLILAGGTATHALLKKDQSISRLRGKFYDYKNEYLEVPIKTALIYHPSYLLRQPLQKRLAWEDLLKIQAYLRENHA